MKLAFDELGEEEKAWPADNIVRPSLTAEHEWGPAVGGIIKCLTLFLALVLISLLHLQSGG